MKKTLSLWCLVCLLVLGRGIFVYANQTVYFTAANDSLLPLTSSTMPTWVDGQIYVPYTVFNTASTGINLGVNSAYNRTSATVTVYSQGKSLLFDLEAGNSTDQRTQTVYSYRGVIRNGIPYLPVVGVGNFFGLTHSYTNTEYGYLLRIKGKGSVLADSRFIDAASSLMSSQLRNYQQGETPATTTPVAPAPNETPQEETITPISTPFALGVTVGGEGSSLLPILEEHNIKGVFFFTVQQLKDQGDLLRQLIGTGHAVGVEVTATTLPQAQEELDIAHTLLAQQTYTTTAMIQAPSSLWQPLQEEGYHCWPGEVVVLTSPQQVVSGLSPQGDTLYFTFQEDSAPTLSQFLVLLSLQGGTPVIPTEALF